MTHRIYAMPFAAIHRAYINKVERKWRSQVELDQVLCWLAGRSAESLAGITVTGATISNFD